MSWHQRHYTDGTPCVIRCRDTCSGGQRAKTVPANRCNSPNAAPPESDELQLPDEEWATLWEEAARARENRRRQPALTAARAASKRGATVAKRRLDEAALEHVVASCTKSLKVDATLPSAASRRLALVERVRAKGSAGDGPSGTEPAVLVTKGFFSLPEVAAGSSDQVCTASSV